MSTRKSRIFGTALAALIAAPMLAAPALADDDAYPVIADEITKKECSACHMAFPAGLLYAGSWTRVMSGLDDHFGENASLDEDTAKHIADYLVANASETLGWPWEGRDEPPIRITESDWWAHEHDEHVRPGEYDDPRIKSKVNCVACHRDADRGYFDD